LARPDCVWMRRANTRHEKRWADSPRRLLGSDLLNTAALLQRQSWRPIARDADPDRLQAIASEIKEEPSSAHSKLRCGSGRIAKLQYRTGRRLTRYINESPDHPASIEEVNVRVAVSVDRNDGARLSLLII
jgi:hypothetical protein